MFVNDIEKIQHTQEVFNCAEILQNSTLIQGSVLGQWLNNFLQKHISFLSIDQIQTLLRSSDKGEEVLNNILSLPEISALRFQVCVWIIRYSSKEEVYESYINKTYEPYRKKIFDSCVAYMEQVLPEEQFDILPISFMKIYRYWNEVRGTYSTEERKRIQQAFERYGENYSQDIFLNEINPGSLPVSCAVKATRRESEAILNNIKYEAKVRSEGTPANVRVSSIIENILMGSKALQDPREYSVPNGRYIAETLSFSYNKEPMAIGDWQEYARIRKEKPRKGSEEAEKIREIRRTLRYTTEPVAIRQWLYSTLVEKVYGYGTQIWPRFDETRVYDNTPKLPQCETRLSDDTIRLAYQGGNTLPSVEAVVSF